MAKRKRTPTAGDKADGKPGSRLLRQLLTFFAQDKVLPVGRSETAGQQGGKLAQTALEHLAADNAEQAVKWTIHAMALYCDLEKRALQFEHADEMRDHADLWGQRYKDIEPAAVQENARRRGKAREAADFRRRLDDAIARLAALRNGKSRMSWTKKIEKAAKDAGISGRAFRKHMPAYLKRSK